MSVLSSLIKRIKKGGNKLYIINIKSFFKMIIIINFEIDKLNDSLALIIIKNKKKKLKYYTRKRYEKKYFWKVSINARTKYR